MKEIDPRTTNRAQQFEIWKNAPNPMLVQFDRIAINAIVTNHTGEASSCDIEFTEDIEK